MSAIGILLDPVMSISGSSSPAAKTTEKSGKDKEVQTLKDTIKKLNKEVAKQENAIEQLQKFKDVKPTVDVLEEWDEELVEKEYLDKKPFVLRGAAQHWPALEWTFESMEEEYGDAKCRAIRYLTKDAASHVVQSIESYCSPTASFMTLGKFIRKHFSKDGSLETKWSIKECKEIFGKYPELEFHLFFENFLPSSLQDREQDNVKFFEIANPGSSTALHTNPIDWNINLQVDGHKLLKFYSPKDERFLYKETERPLQSGEYSAVNPFNVDIEKFPKFHRAKEYEIVVAPGDVVYIPKGWWHAEQTLFDPTMNVSYTIGGPEDSWQSSCEGARLVASHYFEQLWE